MPTFSQLLLLEAIVRTSQFISHDVRRRVLVHLGGQVVSRGEVLEPEEGVPVAGPAPTGIVLHNLFGEKMEMSVIFHE